jgi:hypothetical protein
MQSPFDTSETFADFTSGSLAGPFYLELLEKTGTTPYTPSTPSAPSAPSTPSTPAASATVTCAAGDFLQTLTEAESCELLPSRIMALAHCLSAEPAAVRTMHRVHMTNEDGGEVTVSIDVEKADPAHAQAPRYENVVAQVADSHSGFCNTVLNSIQSEIGTFTTQRTAGQAVEESSAVNEGDAQGAVGECVDDNTFRLFAAKVLAQLADRPGASLSMIHTALHLLSADQTQSLLRMMVQRQLIYSKRGAAAVTLTDPFQARRRRGAAVGAASGAGAAGVRAVREAPVHYFLLNGVLQ